MFLVDFNISTLYGAFHQLMIQIRTRKTSYNFMIYGMIIICGQRLEAVRLPSLYLSPFFHSTLVCSISLSIYCLPGDLYLFIILPGDLYLFIILPVDLYPFIILPGKLEELFPV